jgi:hypothetical protein
VGNFQKYLKKASQWIELIVNDNLNGEPGTTTEQRTQLVHGIESD